MENVILAMNIIDNDKVLECLMKIVQNVNENVSDVVVYLPHVSARDISSLVSFMKLLKISSVQSKVHFLFEENDFDTLFIELVNSLKDLNCKFGSKEDDLIIGDNYFKNVSLSNMVSAEKDDLTMELYDFVADRNQSKLNYYFAVNTLNDFKYVTTISDNFICLPINEYTSVYAKENISSDIKQKNEKVKKQCLS